MLMKINYGIEDVTDDIKDILGVLNRLKDKEKVKKYLDLIESHMDSIDDEEDLFYFIVKYIESSKDKNKVLELTLNHLKLITKYYNNTDEL